MSNYPSESECIGILKNAGCTKRVIIHCCTVRTVAEQMLKRIDCDSELVIAGAMLHDIGRRGLPDEIVNIIKKHTGAGLDHEDIVEMGLPDGDYIPSTIEEKIVAHSDNMVSDNAVVMHSHSVDKLLMKGATRGADRIERLHEELSLLYGEDLDSIVVEIGEFPKIKGPCGKIIN